MRKLSIFVLAIVITFGFGVNVNAADCGGLFGRVAQRAFRPFRANVVQSSQTYSYQESMSYSFRAAPQPAFRQPTQRFFRSFQSQSSCSTGSCPTR